MKAILLSIKPEWLVKILNKEKTIEVRKKFPKDYVGWVYLYCSKSKPYLTRETAAFIYGYDNEPLNGKVVARFWCDKVETLGIKYGKGWETDTMTIKEIEQKSCLDRFKLYDYLKGKNGFAIHISKLEIFDKPRELGEFVVCTAKNHTCVKSFSYPCRKCVYMNELTKAPQNLCYIENID